MERSFRKLIMFRPEKGQPGYKVLGNTMREYYYGSNSPSPEPGYRPSEYTQMPDAINPDRPGSSTHYREGDWVVTKTEEFSADLPFGTYDMIVVCLCEYDPIEPKWQAFDKSTVSVDSFGCKDKFEAWKESQTPEQLSRYNVVG